MEVAVIVLVEVTVTVGAATVWVTFCSAALVLELVLMAISAPVAVHEDNKKSVAIRTNARNCPLFSRIPVALTARRYPRRNL